jgi:RHS repeat-associated protein
VVERLEGTTWTGFDVTLGHLRPPPGTVGNDEPDRSRLILLPSAGWPRGTSYRVRLGNELRDHQGLPVSEEPTLQWTVPAATGDPGTDAVGYEQIFPVGFETWQAAGYQLGGRFPGGQNSLFQGLWTDPITGIAHARARWYDARNAAWLSEDPLKDVDSVNLYAFVGWRPNMGVDPLGLRDATLEDLEAVAELDDRIRRFEDVYAERGVAGTTFLHGRMEHTRWWDPHHEEEVRYWKSYIAVDDESFKRLRAALHRERDSYVAAVEEADDAGEVQYSTVSYNYYTVTEEERAQATRQAAVGQLVQIGMDLASARGARGGRSSQAAARQRALPAPNRGRLPQDVAVNSASPRRLPLNRPIGESAAQRTALREDIRAAQQMGARDIRVNQQQVNAAGERVGRNRPDLQYTRPDGTRVYIEYDTATPGKFPNTPRGRPHADRILANDPNGVVELRTF